MFSSIKNAHMYHTPTQVQNLTVTRPFAKNSTKWVHFMPFPLSAIYIFIAFMSVLKLSYPNEPMYTRYIYTIRVPSKLWLDDATIPTGLACARVWFCTVSHVLIYVQLCSVYVSVCVCVACMWLRVCVFFTSRAVVTCPYLIFWCKSELWTRLFCYHDWMPLSDNS